MKQIKNLNQAVILAGGLGVRLRPLTLNQPKPMVSVAGKPFLEHSIEELRENKIKEIILLVGYLPEKIVNYFGDGCRFGLKIKYSIGDIADETGTRVWRAAPLLADHFLLMYCDNFWPLNLISMVDFYNQKRTLLSTVIYGNKDGRGEYGCENNVFVDAENYVRLYDRTRKDPRLNGVDIGFFIADKSILKLKPEKENFSFEQEILPRLIEQNNLVGYPTHHQYYTITNSDFLLKTEVFLKNRKLTSKKFQA